MSSTIADHSTTGGIYEFGDFRLNPSARTLSNSSGQLRIGGRAFDLLVSLVERAGQVVSKPDLVAMVWGSTVVDDNNLRVHVSLLRKLLNHEDEERPYIESISGHGYCFVADVKHTGAESAGVPVVDGAEVRAFSPPLGLVRIFGRDATIETVSKTLAERRFVSIVGTGGVGKTTVALAIAERVSDRLDMPTRFWDVTSITDPSFIPAALAAVFGLVIHPEKTLAELGESLKGERTLLIVDSCERFVDDICSVIEDLRAIAPEVLVLTTSREPLRARGEQVHRLEALKTPDNDGAMTVEEARRFSAIELFAERAKARFSGFALRDEDVSLVVELCRRLDGLPLAIELAATRIETSGLSGLLSELDDRFHVLTVGRRTALPRHQTLRAMLDWSYEFLPAREQAVLRHLSIFRRNFCLESATGIAAEAETDGESLVQTLSNLVEKSLVIVDRDERFTRFRLLDSTRAYAFEKLKAAGEYRDVARRHAVFWQMVLTSRDSPLRIAMSTPRDTRCIGLLDEIRSALDWTFSVDGDIEIGAALAINAASVWCQRSLMPELKVRISSVIASLRRADGEYDEIIGKLSSIVGHARGLGGGFDASAFQTALAAGEQFGNEQLQLDALYGLCTTAALGGDFRLADTVVKKIGSLAESSESAAVLYERLGALVSFHLGEPSTALTHVDCALQLAGYVASEAAGPLPLRTDFVSALLAIKARILWCLGFPDQAMAVADRAVSRATEVGHLISIGYTLSMGACSVASWVGDDAKLEQYLSMLRAQENDSNVLQWKEWIRCFDIASSVKAGDMTAHKTGLAEAAELSPLAQELLATQNVFIVTPQVLQRADNAQSGWASAEAYREQGEALLQKGGARAEEVAECLFSRAIEIARRQKALSWELRALMSMARLKRQTEGSRLSAEALNDAVGRFSEGFGSRDVQEAKRLLETLSLEI